MCLFVFIFVRELCMDMCDVFFLQKLRKKSICRAEHNNNKYVYKYIGMYILQIIIINIMQKYMRVYYNYTRAIE